MDTAADDSSAGVRFSDAAFRSPARARHCSTRGHGGGRCAGARAADRLPRGYSVRQMADQAAHVRRIAIEKRKRDAAPLRERLRCGRRARHAAAVVRPLPEAAQRRRLPLSGRLRVPPVHHRCEPRRAARSRRSSSAGARSTCGPRSRGSGRPTTSSRSRRSSSAKRRSPSERALISAVIHNRLDQGMPLAIDASLRYGLGVQGTRPLTVRHLRSNSPYNTHRFRGLPPTPITNPGLPSMRAAAKPARVDYRYYLRRPEQPPPLLHGERRGVLREGDRVRLQGLLSASAARRRGAGRRRRPSRARCGRPRRPSRAGRRPGRPPRA